jgi:GNAT superfamily N-acetyltransferase
MGIGRLLMSHMEQWARKKGMTRMQLLADRTNTNALAFYEKIGWRATQLICLRRKGPGKK